MNTYLFLLAWVQDSNSFSGDLAQVHDQNDLEPQFLKGNQHIFAVKIVAPNEAIAKAFGYKEAFFNNYTAHDTASIIVKIDDTDALPLGNIKTITVEA